MTACQTLFPPTTQHNCINSTTMPLISPLLPTFYGYISSTRDALLLFEACLSGTLSPIPQRPLDRERESLIRSGNVFVYEEHSAGIKRWTDGVPWSPSRALGNFLVYRELDHQFPPGEKKRAMKRRKKSTKARETYGYNNEGGSASALMFGSTLSNPLSKEVERSLIGSLLESYRFKEGGLVKKTITVTVQGVTRHLISYYTIDDIMNNKFNTPTYDARFQHVVVRPELTMRQNFRIPIEQVDGMNLIDECPPDASKNVYAMANKNIFYPILPLPKTSPSYAEPSTLFRNNNNASPMSITPGPYDDGSMNSHNAHIARAPAPTMYPVRSTRNIDSRDYEQPSYDYILNISSGTPKSHSRSPNHEYGRSIDSGISAASDQPQHESYTLQSNTPSFNVPSVGTYKFAYHQTTASMRMSDDPFGAPATLKPDWRDEACPAR